LAPDLNDGSLTETINATRPDDVSDCYLMRNVQGRTTALSVTETVFNGCG
jgi:hypothetical protein